MLQVYRNHLFGHLMEAFFDFINVKRILRLSVSMVTGSIYLSPSVSISNRSSSTPLILIVLNDSIINVEIRLIIPVASVVLYSILYRLQNCKKGEKGFLV